MTTKKDDDVVLEPDQDTAETTADSELVEEEEHMAATIQKWREKYKSAEAKAATNLEEAQRAKADFLNSRKRLEEDLERSKERQLNSFVESLLPLCDSFSMALSHAKEAGSSNNPWQKGMEGIYAQLLQLLQSYQVTLIDPTGEHFDPYQHEAVATEDSDQPSETVLRVMQQGYARNGEVLRPAKVIISN